MDLSKIKDSLTQTTINIKVKIVLYEYTVGE